MKKDPADKLLRAVAEYIESIGGKAIVIGGIGIQQWPEDRAMTYRLTIKFTGKNLGPSPAPVAGRSRGCEALVYSVSPQALERTLHRAQ